MPLIKRMIPLLLIAVLTAAITGCAGEQPRTRLGGLPCPGPFTLFELADPDHLGTARYEGCPRPFHDDEVGHGILYTERAGFLDLAHLRESMDWSWYASNKVAGALQRRDAEIEFEGYDMCTFRLTFHYPDDWDSFPKAKRDRLITETSRRIGERVALNAMTWHEVITWFGYATSLVLSEKGSAFTYEDTMSHIVGIAAADDALQNRHGSWDEDATRALRDQLQKLQVVNQAKAKEAVHRVKGKWWKDGECVRRMLDIGQDDGEVRPWLIAEADGQMDETAPPHFAIPTLSNIDGRDFSDLWSMTIEPTLRIPPRVREVCPGHPKLINPATDFPCLIEHIRREVRREYGPYADQPCDHWRFAHDSR